MQANNTIIRWDGKITVKSFFEDVKKNIFVLNPWSTPSCWKCYIEYKRVCNNWVYRKNETCKKVTFVDVLKSKTKKSKMNVVKNLYCWWDEILKL